MGILQGIQQSTLLSSYVSPFIVPNGVPLPLAGSLAPCQLSPHSAQSRGWKPLGQAALALGSSIPHLLCCDRSRPSNSALSWPIHSPVRVCVFWLSDKLPLNRKVSHTYPEGVCVCFWCVLFSRVITVLLAKIWVRYFSIEVFSYCPFLSSVCHFLTHTL